MVATRSGERSPGAVSLATGRNPSEVVVRGRAVVPAPHLREVRAVRFVDPDVRKAYEAVRARVDAREGHPPARRRLQELVLNVAGGCNLTCSYCFAGRGLYSSAKAAWMSPSVARDATAAMLREHPGLARVKYFGGEPFMNLGAIEASFDVLDRFEGSASGRPVARVCVTNMTIFSPRVVGLARRGLRITFSVDGPPEIHDANRRFVSGRGSFVRIVEVLNRYREAGVEPAAVECVYTPRHLAAGMGLSELDAYIRSTFNVSDIIISPCFDSPVTLHDGRTLDERKFADILRADAARLESLKSSESVSGGKREGERRPVLQQVTGATPQMGWCGL